MNRYDLILATALHMDEVSASDSIAVSVQVDSSDNNPLYTLINGLLDECLVEVYNSDPWWRLKQKPFTLPSTATYDKNIGRYVIKLPVPADYLKIAEIKCDEFQRPISEVYSEGSDMAKRQHNRWLVAKVAKPVAVMSHDSTNGREIDCYSLDKASLSGTNLYATYIGIPVLPTDTTTTASAISTDILPDALVAPLEWLTASKAFGARGNTNGMQVCLQNAQNLLI